ncbi:MAG: SUMF1/EgtB/PvdO family nonheme iron enzyme [Polyangiaceae bacterium]|nr:SUMF1/EgtB/PvdO family nonheme iron enzyme [Polyangiaceae bacterium]
MARLRDVLTISAFVGLATVGSFWVLGEARRERDRPARCADGLVAGPTRCCGAGQTEQEGGCRGVATRCSSAQALSTGACVPRRERVAVGPATFHLAATDWEPGVESAAKSAQVPPLWVDAFEVTQERWAECVKGGQCPALGGGEPGQPVRGVPFDAASRFCELEDGRLPTEMEWRYVAAGPPVRRFAWGTTGLVCRRAAFGLERGPCARGATQPELGGSRPDGATPEEVHDLTGNLAEWVVLDDGSGATLGGSFRARLAGELKTTSRVVVPKTLDDVGFRCFYPRSTGAWQSPQP